MGSEPPPSPDFRRQKQKKPDADAEDEGAAEGAGGEGNALDERYSSICTELGLAASPAACRALRVLGNGAEALPQDFAGRSYLGNRGAEALFLALISENGAPASDEKQQSGPLLDLRSLDLAGQGLGNEAARALATFLPRCPKLGDLNLARNHISETGAQSLVQEVALHPGILKVTLEGNPVPSHIRVR